MLQMQLMSMLILMSMLMPALSGMHRQCKKAIWLFVKSLGMQT
jgi:hypothetical protein